MGFFSKKKTSQAAKLVCNPGDIGSFKCIFLASYRKLPIDISWQEPSAADDKLSASLNMNGLKRFPCIEDGDFTVCGSNGSLTYLNIKGNSPSVHPRKARVLATQNYWIQLLAQKLEPLLSDVSGNSTEITNVLAVLDKDLEGNNHIAGEFSLADIHWSALFKFLESEEQSSIFSSFENINEWLAKIKAEIPAYESAAEKVAA